MPSVGLIAFFCNTRSVVDEIREIQRSMDLAHHSISEPFYCRRYIKPIMLAVAMGAFNQLSGISAVLYYTTWIVEPTSLG